MLDYGLKLVEAQDRSKTEALQAIEWWLDNHPEMVWLSAELEGTGVVLTDYRKGYKLRFRYFSIELLKTVARQQDMELRYIGDEQYSFLP